MLNKFLYEKIILGITTVSTSLIIIWKKMKELDNKLNKNNNKINEYR